MSGRVPVEEGAGPCTVRSKLNKFEHIWVRGSMYGEVQCIMGNSHIGSAPLNRQTHSTGNITSLADNKPSTLKGRYTNLLNLNLEILNVM